MLRDNFLKINVGDQVHVTTRFKEGDKERTQTFKGTVIRIKGSDKSRTFTVRTVAKGNVGIERTWPINSPNIVKVKTISSGKIRRSKLYFLRGQVGRASRPKAAT